MSKKKHKFDLTQLIHTGSLKEGETLCYVSDPTKSCTIVRQSTGEYKVKTGTEIITVHAFAQRCLGQDPPDHATKWIRTQAGRSLYELWHAEDEDSLAA